MEVKFSAQYTSWHFKQITMERKIPNFSISEMKEFSFIFKSEQGFLWRLWFLISAPVLWLIKGEVKIK